MEREKKSSPLLAEFHSIVWFQIFPEHISTWDKDKQGSQRFCSTKSFFYMFAVVR